MVACCCTSHLNMFLKISGDNCPVVPVSSKNRPDKRHHPGFGLSPFVDK